MIGQDGNKNDCGRFRRRLRKEPTDAEQAMWRVLRGRQIYGLKFRRQHNFGPYTLDFVCLEKKLIIEVDGGQHGSQVEYDQKRTRDLSTACFRVIRFWNNDVLMNIEAVKERLSTIALETGPHPHPGPPLDGEGEV